MSKLIKCRDPHYTSNGITLVALVVTIIVLLILAGIAISLTVGNNGLFSRAGNAVNTWEKAEANEQEEMKKFESFYDETVKNLGLDGGDESGNIIKKEISKIDGSETKNIETIDKNGDRVVIPAGFIVDKDNNTVADGLVIIDKKAGNADTEGNEFVWIPCTIAGANNTLQYDRYAFEKNGWEYNQEKLEEIDIDKSSKIKVAAIGGGYYHEELSEKEKQSIEKYGGFYIGRYEVGKENEKAKIKSNLPVYNNINRSQAKQLAEGMYRNSRLCSSYAWDTALKFIDGNEGEYAVNSKDDNCGTNRIENTGYHSEKNIFDMGGNVYEWTTEIYSSPDELAVPRGGSFGRDGTSYPAAFRHADTESLSYEYLGCRVTLYL